MSQPHLSARAVIPCLDPNAGPAFSVSNTTNETGPFGERDWDDIYVVPDGAPGGATVGATPCEQITDNHDNAEFGEENYDDTPQLSPCGALIAYAEYDDDGMWNGDLWTVNRDGSTDAPVDPTPGTIQVPDHLEWVGGGETEVLMHGFGIIYRVVLATATETIVTSATGVVGDGSPDGTQIVFLRDAGADWELVVADIDGSNENAILTGLGITTQPNEPVWFPDASRIIYTVDPGTGAGYELRSCLPDGSGDRLEESNLIGFWWKYGMYDDGAGNTSLYYTEDTVVPGPNLPGTWQMYVVPLDGASGKSVINGGPVSGPLSVARASQRGVAHVKQGRVFTIIDSAFYGGTEDLVSVLPDGSDYRVHFAPAEGVGPTNLFQTPVLR